MTTDTPCVKKCYPDRASAKKSMKLLNKTKHVSLTDIYFCEKCKAYHTTSLPKQSNRDYTRHLRNKKS